MEKDTIVLTEQFVRNFLSEERSGHDWWHIDRVTKLAEKLSRAEGGNLFIIKMAALLHDVADEKLNETEAAGIKVVRDWLNQLQVEEEASQEIIDIITNLSFKGGKNRPPMKTIEGKIVQDADRLDAIGAIGIARVFTFSGAKGQLIYDPAIPVRSSMTKEEYRNDETTAINHFYEKLLKLPELMNTESARKLAAKRKRLMEDYLESFFDEWHVK